MKEKKEWPPARLCCPPRLSPHSCQPVVHVHQVVVAVVTWPRQHAGGGCGHGVAWPWRHGSRTSPVLFASWVYAYSPLGLRTPPSCLPPGSCTPALPLACSVIHVCPPCLPMVCVRLPRSCSPLDSCTLGLPLACPLVRVCWPCLSHGDGGMLKEEGKKEGVVVVVVVVVGRDGSARPRL